MAAAENGRPTVTVQTLGAGAVKSYLRPSQAHTIRQQQNLFRRMYTGSLSPYAVQEHVGRLASRTAPTLVRGSNPTLSASHTRPAPQLLRPYYAEAPSHRASPPLIQEPRSSVADVPVQPPATADGGASARAPAATDASRAQRTRAARPQSASSGSSREHGSYHSEVFRLQQQLQQQRADRGSAPMPHHGTRSRHEGDDDEDDDERDVVDVEPGALRLSATQPPYGEATAAAVPAAAGSCSAPSTAAATQARPAHATFRVALRPPLPREATPTRAAWLEAMAADEVPVPSNVPCAAACTAPSASAPSASSASSSAAAPSAAAVVRPSRPASASGTVGTRRAEAVNTEAVNTASLSYRDQPPTRGAPQLENVAAVAAAAAAISAAAASAAASLSAAALAARNLAAATHGQQHQDQQHQQRSQPLQPLPLPPTDSDTQQQWAASRGGPDRARPWVPQRPASASVSGRQARGPEALIPTMAPTSSVVGNGGGSSGDGSSGGGNSGSAGLSHRRGPSLSAALTTHPTPPTRDAIESVIVQRSEIDALRRRTAALQSGASIVAHTSAGPHRLMRHHRPWGTQERRPSAVAPAAAPAAASAAAPTASNAVSSATAVATAPATAPPTSATRPSHRPAPARPASAATGAARSGAGARAPARVEEEEEEAVINVGDYRRQAQRSLMLSHLRESSASFPGLEGIDWAHLDNQGLHAAVSAIVRVHAALNAAGNGEAQMLQQQLSALYAQACKNGAAGLLDDQLALLPCQTCDEPLLLQLAERSMTCAICHDDFAIGESLRTLPCQHTYHASCVGHWLRIKAACPLCNARVRPVKEGKSCP